MVTRRIRSEYMKKFKDPKWDTYTKCYEEMLKYRLTRRLLEHSHNPWFWGGSDTDSDSGGRSPQVQAEGGRDLPEAELEECEGARMGTSVPRLPLQEPEDVTVSSVNASQVEGATETRAVEERSSSRIVPQRDSDKEKDTGGPRQSKPSKPSKQTWHSTRVRPAPARRPREDNQDRKHPFALYASGEKDANISSKKTHNVGPAASTNEIHESALRAKTRREVERQIQKTERRRAKSADQDKARMVVQPEFNPWLTEYMRCFSARSR